MKAASAAVSICIFLEGFYYCSQRFCAKSGHTHACSVVAGRFVLSHPLVASVVTGAMDVGQLSQLLDFAEEGPLDKDVLHAIDAIHQQYPNPCP